MIIVVKSVNEYVMELLDFVSGVISDNQNDNYELVAKIANSDSDNSKSNFEYDVRQLELRTDLVSRLNKMLGEFMDIHINHSKE